MSKPTRFGYPLDLSSAGMTIGNLNLTGQLFQNGGSYASSQWTTTAGNVSYTSGSVIASNLVGTNSTFSNINFTGSLLQNGTAFSGSQWTTTAGNVSYTSGSVVVSNGLSATGNSNTVGSIFTTGGNVGIGTSSPGAKLHVVANGGNNIFEGTDHTYIQLYPYGYSAGRKAFIGFGAANDKNLTLYNEATSGAVILNNAAGGSIRFVNHSTTAMTITGGNVGIGTSNPSAKLHVFESTGTVHGGNSGTIILDHDNSGGASSITFRSKVNRGSDYGYIQYQDALSVGTGGESARLIIGTQNDSDDHIILSPSGNVGIGNNSPSAMLVVGNAVNDQAGSKSTICMSGANSTPQNASLPGMYHRSNVGLGVYSDAHISFQVNGSSSLSDAMRITTAGNIGIGTISPISKLTINGDAGANGVLQIVATNTGDKNIDVACFRASQNGNHIINFTNASGVVRGVIAGVDANSVSYNTSSDRRLKKDIVEMQSMKEKIMQMQPRQFKWKTNNRDDYGFIAQEIFALFPELRQNIDSYSNCTCSCDSNEICESCEVNHDEPIDVSGNSLYYGLDYGKFTPYLTKALQETITELSQTKQELTNLKAALQAKFPGEF